MTQRRVTVTNHLSTVIDVLQLGKKTGILTIERGSGEAFEEGIMTFEHGQVVQAAIGTYQGRDAATKLFSWQACRFSFVPTQPKQIAPASHPEAWMQGDAKAVTENTYGPFSGARQTNLVAQDSVDRRPIVAVYYTEAMDEILHALDHQGFSRTHRRLFLLINGRRSIREMAMLISRTPEETMVLLTDLEQAGFIQL